MTVREAVEKIQKRGRALRRRAQQVGPPCVSPSPAARAARARPRLRRRSRRSGTAPSSPWTRTWRPRTCTCSCPRRGSLGNRRTGSPILDPERCTLCGACRHLPATRPSPSSLPPHDLYGHVPRLRRLFRRLPLPSPYARQPRTRRAGSGDRAGRPGPLPHGALPHREEAMTPPLLRALRKKLDLMLTAIPADALIDSPPGGSCPAHDRWPRSPTPSCWWPSPRRSDSTISGWRIRLSGRSESPWP